MMTATAEFTSVNLSQRHAGQICTPALEYRRVRKGLFHVRWAWDDASFSHDDERRSYARGECRGSLEKCRKAIIAAGINTDDSRSPF